MDESHDRTIEILTRITVDLEGIRVCLGSLVESKIDHEQRLRIVEHWKERLSPLVHAISFALGATLTLMLQWLGN